MGRLNRKIRTGHLGLLALLVLLSGCGRNMVEQPSFETYEANPYFETGTTAQVPPPNTVSRERGAIDPAFFSGQGEDGLLAELPIELTPELLHRGQERFNIYCSPCHNYNGDGRGVVVQRGFPQPRSFHDPNVRGQPVGYYFNAMTNGFGRMFPYASRIPPEDRWAIAGYIRALQLSRFATEEDVPADVELEPTTRGEVN